MPGMDYGLMGLMGLGLGGDIMSGISNYEQARRQRQQYDYAKQFQNPQWVLSQSQPYINQLNAALRAQTPNLMRTEVNPMIGSRGIDPASGAGQSIYAQALAPYILQNQQQGMQQFLNAAGQGQQYGTTNVGPVYGNGQGLQQALYAYYNRRPAGPGQTPVAPTSTVAPLQSAPMSTGYTGGLDPWTKSFLQGTGNPPDYGNDYTSQYGR